MHFDYRSKLFVVVLNILFVLFLSLDFTSK